jgi:hypothetical protein
MKPVAFFALLLCSANVLAQTPAEQIAKLQNDPNIIWIGEFYRDYEDLDNGYEGRNIDRYRPDTLPDGSILHAHSQKTSILKLERRLPAADDWQHYFWAQIIDSRTKIFADADLSQPISDKERKNYVMGKDTVDSFDPETFASIKAVWEYELNPENIRAYRMRQLVYYNAKENMYYNLPLSIAPITIEGDKNGNPIGTKPLFWLPIIASSTPINLGKADNMPFIKSVQMHFPFADAKVLKESKKIEAVNQIWRESIIAEKDKIFAVGILYLDNENQKPLSSKEINDIFFAPDTIIVMDSITFMEHVKPITRDINTDITELRINQTFGWDDKKKTLTVSTYSIAPIVNRYDDNRNLLYIGPLFYLYPHRCFKTAK